MRIVCVHVHLTYTGGIETYRRLQMYLQSERGLSSAGMYIQSRQHLHVPWKASRYAETVVQLISRAFARITQPTSKASFTRGALSGFWKVWN